MESRSGRWWRLLPPELEVLDDPARVADHLALDDQHRNSALAAQSLDLGTVRAAQRHPHLLVGDALAVERARDLAARAEPVRRGRAAIERGHQRYTRLESAPAKRSASGWRAGRVSSPA